MTSNHTQKSLGQGGITRSFCWGLADVSLGCGPIQGGITQNVANTPCHFAALCKAGTGATGDEVETSNDMKLINETT